MVGKTVELAWGYKSTYNIYAASETDYIRGCSRRRALTAFPRTHFRPSCDSHKLYLVFSVYRLAFKFGVTDQTWKKNEARKPPAPATAAAAHLFRTSETQFNTMILLAIVIGFPSLPPPPPFVFQHCRRPR